MKTCSYCGRENEDISRSCWECGTDLLAPVISGAGSLQFASCVPFIVIWHFLTGLYLLIAEEAVIWSASVVAYWLALTVGLVRKKGRFTRATAFIVSHGLIFICIFAMCLFFLIARLRGLI